MADEARRRVPAGARVFDERLRAADVVDVSVRVRDRVYARIRPAAQAGEDRRCEDLEARVEEHESLARAQRDQVRERLDQRDAVADLGELAGRPIHGAGSLVHAFVDVDSRKSE